MRILLTVRFDGSDYCGFQSQINAKSVQDTIECAINMVTAEGNRVFAAGRTDEGVHAFAMPMHFDTKRSYAPNRFKAAINNFLPKDIRIIEAEQVADDFHARYHATSKTYLYKLYQSRELDPLRSRYYGKVSANLDIKKMKEAARLLVGEHDFSAFMKKGGKEGRSTIRTVYSINIHSIQDEVFIYVTGNGFLYNMVRIMVALLVKIGSGECEINTVKSALLSGTREFTRGVAPPCGLYLLDVYYPLDLKQRMVRAVQEDDSEIESLLSYQNRNEFAEADNLHVVPYAADDED